ncbi:MAG: hypothetical protein JSV97_10005 [candidate division WOR-3 bacterium]|nr:MAG: hypothetical protein JSV97_10005 [candidate division WOR-3 bacterium]
MKVQHTAMTILLVLAIVSPPIVSCKSSVRTGAKKHEIPFRLPRNQIMLPVKVGDSRELRVILDTGMHFEGLLVYNPDLKDSITVENAIEVLVPGAGADSASRAIMTDSGSFQVGNVEFINQRIIVLQNDMMKGFPSDGVTGYSLFGNFIVEVDYDKMLITLHESEKIEVDSSWEWLQMTFKDYQIPWIEAVINIEGDEEVPVSLYIDLASSEVLELLIKTEMKFHLPEKLKDSYLGRGLSGDIYGYKGRISSLKLGSFYLQDVVTAFAPAEVRSKQEGADGIIGSDALRRFNLIFDYKNAKLYLKPNSFFSEPF